MFAPFVVMDAVIHVASSSLGSPAFATASLFLFERVSKLLQKELVLFDLGLELTELF